MKSKNLLLGLLTILCNYSCDSNRCDEGYTEVVLDDRTEICVPDYVVGIEKSVEYGNIFYHNEYGIIQFHNGVWKNSKGENITDFLDVEY